MDAINRSAIVVRPAQPFLDWLHRVDSTSAHLNVQDLQQEPTIYLVPECDSLDQALDCLDGDREFLTKGGVFTNAFIDAYIELKMQEVTRFRMTTHPLEFDMYYSL